MASTFIGLVSSTNPYTAQLGNGTLISMSFRDDLSAFKLFPEVWLNCFLHFLSLLKLDLPKFPKDKLFTNCSILLNRISAFILIPSPYSRNLSLPLW